MLFEKHLKKKLFGQFWPKNNNLVWRVAEKKIVHENPHHPPPQMINGRPLRFCATYLNIVQHT